MLVLGCHGKKPPETEEKLTILFGGDVMFDRGVRSVANRMGYNWLLQDLAALSKYTDAFVVNLETPVAEDSTPILKKFVFNSDTACILALKRAGITHLNLANNHSIDHGKFGLEATFRNILSRDLAFMGAGLGIEAACMPVVIKNGNIRVALFSSVLLPLERWYNTEGAPCICTESATELAERIKIWLKDYPDDIPIVQLHWGVEYRFNPELHQLKDAELLVSAGVKLVVGHHPHVVQEIRFMDGVPVVFSLGNLVFDNPREETRQTGVLKVEVDADANVGIGFYPFLIEKCKPRKTNASESEAFVLKLSKYSNVKFNLSEGFCSFTE